MTVDTNHRHPSSARRIGVIATAAALTMGLTAGTLPAMAEEAAHTGDTASDGSQTTTPDTARAYTIQLDAGHTAKLTKNADGAYEGSIDWNGQPPAEVTAISTDTTPATVKLTGSIGDPTVNTDTIGMATATGTAIYEGTHDGDKLKLIVNYTQTAGQKITLGAANGGREFDKDGKATLDNLTLDKDDKPSADTITLSDGTMLPITWNPTTGTETDTANNQLITSRTGVATGTLALTAFGSNHTWNVTVNVKATRASTWTGTVNGQTKPFPVDANGLQKLTFDQTDKYPGDMTVTGGGKTITLKPSSGDHSSTSGELGQMTVTGTADYKNDGTPSLNATVPFSYTVGEKTTIKDGGITFSKTGDDTYEASYDKFTLDTSNKPSGSEIELSDGSKTKVTWDKTTGTVDKDNGNGGTATFVRLKGTATGTVTVTDPDTGEKQTQTYTIHVTADRTQDKSFNGLTVTQTNAKGDKATLTVGKFDSATHEYTLSPLPYSAVGDAFTLNVDAGVDADTGKPTLTLGDNTSRVFTVTVNGAEYKVTVPFQSSDIKTDSPAKLTGIYVNYTGEATQGQLIDNWDPNRLDYVIPLTADAKAPYVLPIAPDGVTISAGDVTQSAQSVKQVWKVTDTATGQSREYSVTATRPVKTAVTEFKPKDPVKQDTSVEPKDDKDADLASHGYVDANGKYTPVADDTYTIPEGGVFSYEAKTGQSTTVSVTHEAMTYTYTVTVLPKDMNGYPQQHVYKVTYLTDATHLAELTGIGVDGQLIGGFDKSKHEYTVPVNDVDEWVVTPQYDKTTGMTVSTKKDKQDATITVTSGDGLNTVEYKLHVTQKPFGGAGTVGVGGDLANTGISMGVVSGIIGVLAVIGGVFYALTRRSRRNNDTDQPEPASDVTPTGDTPSDQPAE